MVKRMIRRPDYLKKIHPFMEQDLIKVIMGQRRVGKSYVMYQLMERIRKTKKNALVIYINKEMHEFDSIGNHRDLISYISNKKKPGQKTYLFIDEIQEIDDFEKALRSLAAKKAFDIYCSGSNARLLSGELATYLSGRYIEVEVFSLSYSEFLTFHRLQDNEDTFYKYILYGGMPYLINLSLEKEVINEYLRSIYNTIILKDVVARFNIRNVNFLQRLVEFLGDNLGSIVSAKSISDFLKSQKTRMSPNVVLNYLSYLSDSFFVFKTPRSSIEGRKIFEVGEKYYFNDLGIRNTIIPFIQKDISKILENLVYMHLKRLGYSVTVGWQSGREIDFIGAKSDEKVYVQVAYLIVNEKVHDREFGNLINVKDNHPKYVVSMDKIKAQSFKGIKHLNVRDFLLLNHL